MENGDSIPEEAALLFDDLKPIIAMRLAIVDVIEDHCKSGHPLIIWRDGKVFRQPPEEAKRNLEAEMKKYPWLYRLKAGTKQNA